MNFDLELKTPPIVEAVIGVLLNKLDKDDIVYLHESLREKYPNSNKIRMLSVDVADTKASTRFDTVLGSKLANSNMSEEVYLEENRIALSDKNKYENFDHIFDKYKDVYGLLLERKPNIEVKTVGFRCVNKFDLYLKNGDGNKFYIHPTIRFTNGGLNSYFSSVIISSGYYSADAEVRTRYIVKAADILEVVFEIDIHSLVTNNNIDSIKETLLRIRNFRNEIFKSNFAPEFIEERFNK